MPPRSLTVAIVVFWTATMAWFFSRDLWPRFFANDRPPFSINLEEEAKAPPLSDKVIFRRDGDKVRRIGNATTAWDLFINQESAGEVLTLVRAGDDHGYELYTTVRLDTVQPLLRGIPGFDG